MNAKEQSKTGEADGSVDRKQIRASTRVGTTHIPGTQAHVVSTRAAKQKSITPSPIASVLSTARYQDGAGFDNDGDIEEIQDPSILQNTKHKIRKAISKKKNSPWNSLARKASTTMATKLDSPRSADLLTQRLFPSVNASPISNFPALSTSDSGYKDGNSGIASQRRRRREGKSRPSFPIMSRTLITSSGDHSEDERPTRRPRLEQPLIRDTLEYLQGDFDYGAAELALEVTPDMIQEAKAMNRIQVGPYLLCRFRVEMNVMWAVRVATARWAQKLHS